MDERVITGWDVGADAVDNFKFIIATPLGLMPFIGI
jgi:hypothetical protein